MRNTFFTSKLRKSFVLIIMLVVAMVLLLSSCTVLGISIYTAVEKNDALIEYISETDGDFTGAENRLKGRNKNGWLIPEHIVPECPVVNEETKYKTRFFIVYINEKDPETGYTFNMDNIASVNESEAKEYAQRVLSKKNETGMADHFRYLVSDTAAGRKIVFLECSEYISNFIAIFKNALLGMALVLALAFIIALLFSARAVRPFEEAMVKQKRFITDASHEIKTPIAIISANSEVLRLECGDNKWLNSIERQIGRIGVLISNLVELTKYDEGEAALVPGEFNISDAVLDTIADFEYTAESLGAEMQINVEPDIKYKGDETSVRQLTAILCDNAIKYCTGQMKISVTLRKRLHGVILEVYNTAENITEKQLKHIFDRFYRLDTSRSRESGGYGIGLSIAESIVHAHKGKITARNIDDENGEGVLISAILP